MGILFGLAAGFSLSFAPSALADIINVYSTDSPTTNIARITGATAGDTVLIHPGTYAFCVVLTHSGTEGNPIVIKGSDPNNRPVFDLGAYEDFTVTTDTYYNATDDGMGSWPGGYWGAGIGIAPHSESSHWNRGMITLVDCGYVNIEDIEIRNVHKHQGDSNAIRAMIKDGPINVTRVKTVDCDNGLDVLALTGDGDDTLTASYCDFGYSGRYPNRPLSPGGHNVYTHGAALVLEYCYIHHAREGQNLHLRNTFADIRYCWLEYPWTYHLDQCAIYTGNLPAEQVHTYIGNVFVDYRGDNAVANHVFVVMEGSLMGASRQEDVPQRMNLYYNTFVGIGDARYLVSFSGDASVMTYRPSLHMYNNIIWGNTHPLRTQYTGEYGTVDIQYNWWPTADYSAWSSYMRNNIFGSDPGFVDRAGGNYTLTESAQARSAANSSLGELPDHEYVYHLDGKLRTAWANLGAFEYPQDYQAPLSGPITKIRPTP